MKKIQLLGFTSVAILLFSCHQKSASGAKPTDSAAAPALKNVVVDAKADMNATGASYTIDSIGLNGTTLSVFVNYSGGCKDHSFELVSDGMIAKSLPPQVTLCLKHTNNDDACRKLVMQELKFNISAILYKGSKTTVLKLADKHVTYVGQ